MNPDNIVYKTIFLDEAQRIPTEILQGDEKEIIMKCREQEELSEEEMAYLKTVLSRYRDAINKHDTKQILDNVEKTQKIIKSEKDLLRLLDNQDNYKLKMKYKVGNEEIILSLIVKPLSDSQAIFELETHIGLFNVANTEEEKDVINRLYEGETEFSPEEERLIKYLTEKAMEKTKGDRNAIVNGWNEFLARQVEFENCTFNTFGEKLEFWKKIDVSTKVSLYNKVREILRLDDLNTDDLFLDG